VLLLFCREELKCVLRDCNVLKQELRVEENRVYSLHEERDQQEVALRAAQEDASTLQIHMDSLSTELEECKAERDALKAANVQLIAENAACQEDIVTLQKEKQQLKSNMDATAQLSAERAKAEQLALDLNQFKKKNDSLSRELKRVLKDQKDVHQADQGWEAKLKLKARECEVCLCGV
jgi:chromosome segregation ATPase